MGVRRKAREHALRILFFMDIQHIKTLEPDMLNLYYEIHQPAEKQRYYIADLMNGVVRHKNQIDALIETYSNHWKLSRMSCVDRNILRISIYEMLFRKDIPAKVSINEAIEIGKLYGTEDSGSFINGILDRIHIAINSKEIQTDADLQSKQPSYNEGETQ